MPRLCMKEEEWCEMRMFRMVWDLSLLGKYLNNSITVTRHMAGIYNVTTAHSSKGYRMMSRLGSRPTPRSPGYITRRS